MKLCYSYIFSAGILLASCKTSFLPAAVEYNNYPVSVQQKKDSSLYYLIQPYRDSVNKSMSEVIAVADKTLSKKQPEGTLGNFMADALLYMSRKKFDTTVDAAFINYGGIRIDELAAGPVTKGRIYELMPFDNIVVLLNIEGNVLQQFLDLTATWGGWPVAGITMQINNKKAVNVFINNKPLEQNKTYTIALSDYVANGGDNAAMLKDNPQKNIGYLLRNTLFDYINELKKEGKNISANIEGRVTL